MPKGKGIAIRRILNDDWYQVVQLRREGPALQIELESEEYATAVSIVPPLVEIDCVEAIYFGEVRHLQGRLLVVAVEHCLNRKKLSALQKAWYGDQAGEEDFSGRTEAANE